MFLRRLARPLMMMSNVKETTGIVGRDVVLDAPLVRIRVYDKTVEIKKEMPEDEGYRKAVESFTRLRLKVCPEEEKSEANEKKVGCGQVEELTEEAQDDLKLSILMNVSIDGVGDGVAAAAAAALPTIVATIAVLAAAAGATATALIAVAAGGAGAVSAAVAIAATTIVAAFVPIDVSDVPFLATAAIVSAAVGVLLLLLHYCLASNVKANDHSKTMEE